MQAPGGHPSQKPGVLLPTGSHAGVAGRSNRARNRGSREARRRAPPVNRRLGRTRAGEWGRRRAELRIPSASPRGVSGRDPTRRHAAIASLPARAYALPMASARQRPWQGRRPPQAESAARRVWRAPCGAAKTATLTQSMLAARLKVSRRQIAYYESGQGRPPGALLAKLADLFQISTDSLLGRRRPQAPTARPRGRRPARPHRAHGRRRVAPPRRAPRSIHRERARAPLSRRYGASRLTTRPPFITKRTCSTVLMSVSGLPATAIRSA